MRGFPLGRSLTALALSGLAIGACNFASDFARYCDRTGNCDAGASDAGASDAATADSGLTQDAGSDAGADSGVSCSVPAHAVVASGGPWPSASLALGASIGVIAYGKPVSAGSFSFTPLDLDALTGTLPTQLAGSAPVVTATSDGFAIAFVGASGIPAVQFLDAGAQRRGSGSAYLGAHVSSLYPVSIASDGTKAALVWDDDRDGGKPAPFLVLQDPNASAGQPVAIATNVQGDVIDVPTLGNRFLNGQCPFAFGDIVGSVNFQFWELLEDGGLVFPALAPMLEGDTRSIGGASVVTVGASGAVVWLGDGGLRLAPPGAKQGTPLGIGSDAPPSFVALSGADAAYGLCYLDAGALLVRSLDGAGGVVGTDAVLASGGALTCSLSFDPARRRYVAAFTTDAGQVMVGAACVP